MALWRDKSRAEGLVYFRAVQYICLCLSMALVFQIKCNGAGLIHFDMQGRIASMPLEVAPCCQLVAFSDSPSVIYKLLFSFASASLTSRLMSSLTPLAEGRLPFVLLLFAEGNQS